MAKKEAYKDDRVEVADRKPYAGDVELLIGKGFSPDERQLIDHKLEAYQEERERSARIKARYLIDVVFGMGYSTQRPSGGMIMYLENGALDGDGQGSVYLCPNGDCGRPFPAGAVGGEKVYCPSCDRMWERREIDGGRFVKLGVQGWADALLRVMQQLTLNADIRLVYCMEDIRRSTLLEQESSKQGELIGDARRDRVARVYWLHDIVKDTTHGADLRSRILAFLKA